MSIRAKRGTTAQINAAAAASGLKVSELIYDTDKGSLEVATGAGSRQALMREAFATKAQAEAGTDNTMPMTPLRTAQAIAAKRGVANGVASLGADGKVPKNHIPLVGYGEVGSYVIAASLATNVKQEFLPGHTVSGSSLIRASTTPSSGPASLNSPSASSLQLYTQQNSTLGLSGTWALMTRIYGDTTYVPIALYQRIA